jgi:hypothetical protein
MDVDDGGMDVEENGNFIARRYLINDDLYANLKLVPF